MHIVALLKVDRDRDGILAIKMLTEMYRGTNTIAFLVQQEPV